MSFFDHLEELRWHIIRSAIAVVVFMIVAFLNKRFIFDYVLFGPVREDFPTYRALCYLSDKIMLSDRFCINEITFNIINLELAGQFLVHLKTSLILGFVISFPYIFWEMWRFIKPALYSEEMKYSRVIIFFSSLLFFMGIAFGYYVLMPFSVNFFANYEVSSAIGNNFSLKNYMGFITMFVMASGILFELPMVVYFLAKVGLVGPDMMRSYRKHAFVVILLIAAIITPADVGTQIMVTLPVCILYEISIFIAARVEKNRLAKMDS
ncbi:MAG: twin-arginine translocase subunit TatC [Chitinophagales bacterium]|nr:twin-arginine translocase subunit TatC [Chitinophagales bacterium]